MKRSLFFILGILLSGSIDAKQQAGMPSGPNIVVFTVDDMDITSVSSEDVAASLIKAMARRRMYDVPQLDAKITWWAARAFPETFRRVMLYMYRHRLWIFNTKK